ncbi:MAG: hypothetical protein ABIQ66_11540 [Novosphingobium sp.]
MTIILLAASAPALAEDTLAGRYRLEGDHDAAGELLLRDDGRFEYGLAYGALDEHAEGRWVRHGNVIALTTLPKPVPPRFQLAPRSKPVPHSPTLHVTWPNGRGVAGVDFRIGFDVGSPIAAYTQEDGWSLPQEEHRIPRWIELVEPIYGIVSPRYPIAEGTSGTLNLMIIPNDIGAVDFSGMVVDVLPDELLIHRGRGEMRFVRKSAQP